MSALKVKTIRGFKLTRPLISVHGRTIFLCLDRSIDAHVCIFDLRGKTVGLSDCAKSASGLYAVSIKGLSAGPYIVEIGKGMSRIRSKVFLQ